MTMLLKITAEFDMQMLAMRHRCRLSISNAFLWQVILRKWSVS